MKKNNYIDLFKKCFGKNKDTRYHAIAMLIIYGFVLLILIIFLRVGGSNTTGDNTLKPTPPATTNPTNNPPPKEDKDDDNNIIMDDINYSYVYKILYNNHQELFTGQKIDEKEKFTYLSDNVIKNYAILGGNFLILENDSYSITETPSSYFKYCDVEEILLLVEDAIVVESGNTYSYKIPNSEMLKVFGDLLVSDNRQDNKIVLTVVDNNLKSIDLDFSNYIYSITGVDATLQIKLEFANVGTTPDFQINF